MKFIASDLKECNHFFPNLKDSDIIFQSLTMYNILLETMNTPSEWFWNAYCFKKCAKMTYFPTDYLIIWVQRSPAELPIKVLLCHFICVLLLGTQDHHKKLHSSKEDTEKFSSKIRQRCTVQPFKQLIEYWHLFLSFT